MNKVVFQCSSFKPPEFIVNFIKLKSNNWEYRHFCNNEMIDFIKNNPNEEFEKILQVFNDIKLQEDKFDFFMLYFLYLNGGLFINSLIKLEKQLDDIIENYSFVSVESLLKNDSLFCGFLYAEKNNAVIHTCLIHMYNTYLHKLNNNFGNHNYFSKKIYQIYHDLVKPETSYKLYNEKLDENNYYAITYNSKGDHLFFHYFKSQFIQDESIIFEEKKRKDPKNTKIGITMNLPTDVIGLFSSGIRQNTLYMNELLLNIGFDSYLIVDDCVLHKINNSDLEVILYDGKFKIKRVSEILISDFDLVFSFGFEIPILAFKILKYMKVKLVSYKCGNNYIIDSEKILYNQHNDSGVSFVKKDEDYFDEIWSIPQMTNTNKHYWEIMYRTPCKEVPFIWSSESINFSKKMDIGNNNCLQYQKKDRDGKKIAIFEPNISIMKWCLPSILICEKTYRNIGKKLNHVYVTNIPKKDSPKNINDFNLNKLVEFSKYLDLTIDNKITIEGRFNTLYFMSKYADIAVSHQWENPLNYLYLDLAWMGWPVLHNAHLCKDIGYYYENFDYDMGSKVLENIINNHDDNINYMMDNRKKIERYLPSNKSLQDAYKNLIENLFL